MAAARAATSSSPRTSGGSGQMVPNRRRRRSMRAGHRNRTWRGVSASSRHTVHRPAGQLMSEHCRKSLDGFLPIRWRFGW